MQQLRSEGELLVLDGGDSLFPKRGARDPEKALLILRAMAATGVMAAAVGESDLALGVDWLVRASKESGVPYLSSNLKGEEGALPFEGGKILEVAGNRIGIFSVLESRGPLPAGWTLADPVETARQEVERLRGQKVDLILVLAHGPASTANRLAGIAGIDLVLPSHEGASTKPYRMAESWVVNLGAEGKSLLRLDMDLRGSGPIVSTWYRKQLETRKGKAQESLRRVREGGPKDGREEAVARLERELAGVERQEALLGTGRPFDSRVLTLDEGMEEDPIFLEEIRKLQPSP